MLINLVFQRFCKREQYKEKWTGPDVLPIINLKNRKEKMKESKESMHKNQLLQYDESKLSSPHVK